MTTSPGLAVPVDDVTPAGNVVEVERNLDRRWRIAAVLTAALGLLARLEVILRSGGIRGIPGYDCGVYFAGADALLHGRLPYRDFTLVHPPGITVLLTPFAALTYLMSDWHAFMLACLAFCVLGGVNIWLVILVCRRFGINRPGSIVAGVFYAAWFGSISAEFQVKLEPLGNAFFVCALLAMLHAQRSPRRWSDLLAGLLLGLPLAVKIWWVVPVAVLVLWYGARPGRVGAGLKLLAGAAISASVIYLPFFLLDPSGLWKSVFAGQLGRQRASEPLRFRLTGLSTLNELSSSAWSNLAQLLIAIGYAAVLLLVLVIAWRAVRRTRVMVALFVIQLGVELAAPPWFEYYSDYLAIALAVSIGAAASTLDSHRLRALPAYGLTALTVLITTAVTVAGTHAVRPYDGATALTRAARAHRCVMSNNPTVLLRLNTLTRDLSDGCPNWIDMTGRRMGPDRPNLLAARGQTWAGVVQRYLESGDAIVIWQPAGSHYLKVVRQHVSHNGVIARAGGHTMYRARPAF